MEPQRFAIPMQDSFASPQIRSAPSRIQSKPRMYADSSARLQDAELIREAQKGSRVAFDALVRQYDQAVLRLALHLTGSEQDAQDIHQEAFLKAYRHIGSFRFSAPSIPGSIALSPIFASICCAAARHAAKIPRSLLTQPARNTTP